MYPANAFAKVLYNDRLREAEQARLARSQKKQQQAETVVQLRRRRSNWIRALLGRKAVAR
jgi:hypothetical protein